MCVHSDAQSISSIHRMCLDTNKQQFYLHKTQYETHLEATLRFERAPSSPLCCDPEADSVCGDSCQGVDGVQRRMELQACTKVQVPDVPPGSCVLAYEGAVLIERYLGPFAVIHQTVVAVRSPHDGLGGGLAPLKPLFLLTYKNKEGQTSD